MTKTARIVVHYPRSRGAVFLRGEHAPLDWSRDTEPVSTTGDESIFEVSVRNGETLGAQARARTAWAAGRNLVLAPGDEFDLHPSFGDPRGSLLPEDSIATADGSELRVPRVPAAELRRAGRGALSGALRAGRAVAGGPTTAAPAARELDHVLAELWSLGACRRSSSCRSTPAAVASTGSRPCPIASTAAAAPTRTCRRSCAT